MIKNRLNGERYYFEAFIKTVQYLATLITHKNIMIRLEKLVKKFYLSDFFAFFECGVDEIIIERLNKFSNAPFSKKGLEKIEETIVQVMESGIFAAELINPPDPYAMVFLPISKADQIISVIVIGHKYSERLPKYLLNIYLALGGLIGRTIENLTMIQELRKQHNKLKENERFLTNIFSSITDGICVIDTDYNIIRVNPTMKKWYLHMEPLLGKKCYQVYMNKTEACKNCRLDELFETNIPFEKVIPRKGNHGEILGILDVYTFPLHDQETGKSTGAIVYIRDITERRKAELKLKESEEKYKNERDNFINILDSMEDGVYIVNQQYDIEYVNPILTEEFGLPESKKCYNYFHDREEVCPWCKNQEILAGNTVRWEWYSSKNQKTYDLIDTPLKNLDGSISKLEIFRDITERKKAELKLKESEEKFRTLVSNIPGAVYRTAADEYWTVEIISEAIKDISGFTASDFIQNKVRSYASIIHPDDVELVEKTVYSAIDKGEPYIIEYRIINSNGEVVWVYEKGRGILGEDGKILWLDGAVFDITERKQTEIKLKESEEKYRYLIENSLEGVWVIDSNANAILINPSMAKMLGYTVEEMTGKSLFLFMDEKEIKNTKKHLEKRKNGISEERDSEMIHKNGKKVYLRVRASPIFDIEGNYNGTFAFLSNITQRKLTEQTLKESEEKYRSLVETTNDWIWEVDENGVYTYSSPKIKDILGYNIEEVIGKTPFDLMPSSEAERVRKLFQEAIQSNQPIISLENNNMHKNGYLITLETSGVPFFNVEGKLLGYRGIDRDITERKKVEEKLKDSENKYREAYNRAEFYKDIFAHDINNILQIILSGMQVSRLILTIPEKIESLKYNAQIMEEQVIRGAKLVSNVRKLSQLEETKQSLKKIEICNILKNTISILKKSYGDKKISIRVDSVGEKLCVKANYFLEDMFENILSNAVRHNRNLIIEITVRISREKKEGINYLKIEFLDNGIGVDDVSKEEIFKRGYSEEKRVHGMGLGLSLVSGIIETYNGKIWVKDRVEGDRSKGCNFVVLIPEVD